MAEKDVKTSPEMEMVEKEVADIKTFFSDKLEEGQTVQSEELTRIVARPGAHDQGVIIEPGNGFMPQVLKHLRARSTVDDTQSTALLKGNMVAAWCNQELADRT